MKSEYDKVSAAVNSNRSRARKLGLPDTLTVEQWLTTIAHFGGKCAYCLERPYEVLDHFIPLNPGISPFITLHKGTTADNCIPACRICNKLKEAESPEYTLKWYYEEGHDASRVFPTREVILRIAEYLNIVRELVREPQR